MKPMTLFLLVGAGLFFLAPIKVSVPILIGAWLKREHLWSFVTGAEPRADAALRTVGLRTHKTPIPPKKPKAPKPATS